MGRVTTRGLLQANKMQADTIDDLRAQLQQAQEERDVEQQGRQGAERQRDAAIGRGKEAWRFFNAAMVEAIGATKRANAAERDAAEQRALAERLADELETARVALQALTPAEAQEEAPDA